MKINKQEIQDDLMKQIIILLMKEIEDGVMYPLMATYSKNTCDHKELENCDYPCVNIKHDSEVIAVDVYFDGEKLVLAMFIREGNVSLYKMTKGKNKDDNKLRKIMDECDINGFMVNTNTGSFGRREKCINWKEQENVSEENINNVVCHVACKVVDELKIIARAFDNKQNCGKCGEMSC